MSKPFLQPGYLYPIELLQRPLTAGVWNPGDLLDSDGSQRLAEMYAPNERRGEHLQQDKADTFEKVAAAGAGHGRTHPAPNAASQAAAVKFSGVVIDKPQEPLPGGVDRLSPRKSFMNEMIRASKNGKNRQLPHFGSVDAVLCGFSQFGEGKKLFDTVLDTERGLAYEDMYHGALCGEALDQDDYELKQSEAQRRERAVFSLMQFGPALVNEYGADPFLIAVVLQARGPWNILASITQLILHITTHHYCDTNEMIIDASDNPWHTEGLVYLKHSSLPDGLAISSTEHFLMMLRVITTDNVPSFFGSGSPEKVYDVGLALAKWGPYLVARFGFCAADLVEMVVNDEPEIILSEIKNVLLNIQMPLSGSAMPRLQNLQSTQQISQTKLLRLSSLQACQETLAQLGILVDESITLHEAQSLIRWLPLLRDSGFDISWLYLCHNDYRVRCVLYPILACGASTLLQQGILTTKTLVTMTNHLGMHFPLREMLEYIPYLRALGYSEQLILDVVFKFSPKRLNTHSTLARYLKIIAEITPHQQAQGLNHNDILERLEQTVNSMQMLS